MEQWEISHLGEGFSIRSVSSGKYLTIEAGIYNGVPIAVSGFPVSWMIELSATGETLELVDYPLIN